ncbi:signal peptidase II [candidate division WOR-3 bacterium]|nr:signal peptidase II [candidate division WOR-3 bacterium]
MKKSGYKGSTKKNKSKKGSGKKGLFTSILDRISGMTWAKPRQWLLALIPAACVFTADQVSKAILVAKLKYVGAQVWVIEPLLKLTYARNEAGLFSLVYGPPWLYIVLMSVAMVLVIVFLLRPQKTLIAVLLGFILGGGIGNLFDRIRVGYVVDWISMGLKNWRWATYNIADASIVVSVIAVLIFEFFFSKPKKKEAGEEKS